MKDFFVCNEKQRWKTKTETEKIRPSRSENTILNEWMEPEKLELISYWARDGYTEQAIAEKMGMAILLVSRILTALRIILV